MIYTEYYPLQASHFTRGVKRKTFIIREGCYGRTIYSLRLQNGRIGKYLYDNYYKAHC